MAKRVKSLDVQKFGGIESLGTIAGNVTDNPLEGISGHELSSVEVESKTKLESDRGTGRAVVMRSFVFKASQNAFKVHIPTKQELFNTHYKGLEIALWKDGLTFAQEYEPHLLFNKKKTHYTIFVVATPSSGNVLLETPQTLSQIAHG